MVDLPSRYVGGRYWRDKAEEVRTLAEGFRDPAARRAMLEIAINLEAIAARVDVVLTRLNLADDGDWLTG